MHTFFYFSHDATHFISSAEDKAVLFDIKLLVTDGTVFPEGATIIFNQPIINSGNTYRTDLGIFEPPVNGVYSFTATICTVIETWMIIGLMKDGTILDEFMIGDYLWHTCSTITAYTYVTTANTVFVKVLRTYRGILTSKMGVSSFKGILITTLKP